MSYPRQGEEVLGFVVDDGAETDKKQSGACRVYIPSQYSNEFKLENLPLIPRCGSGGNESVVSFGGAIELGTPVTIKKNLGLSGTSLGVITAVHKDETNSNLSVPGNVNREWHKIIAEAIKKKVPINSKAKAGSGEAGSKPTEESGPKYSRDLVTGIPSTATLWPIAGMRIPQVNSVETAVQAFSSIIPSSALSSLPGIGLSLGNLFNNMPSAIKNEINSKLPKDVGDTLNTIINLIPENSADGLSGIRVNPEVFYVNAAKILSECRDTSDLIHCIMMLLSDTSLHGTDTLPNVTIEIDTPFGKANVEFDVKGTGSEKTDDTVKKIIGTFTSLLSNAGGFPSVFPDKNMWGQSSQVMADMFKRLEPAEYKKAVEQAQKAIAPGTQERTNLNKAVSLAMTGGDIFGALT
jgi:hypothetical protein